MMNKTASVPSVLKGLCLGMLVLFAGCVDIGSQTAPSRFYVLSATDPTTAPSPSGLSLLVGPVTLPRYLDRPQIVTRSNPNQLELAEYDRWGGRLDDNFARVLSQDISVHLNTSRVALFPRDQRSSDAVQISVDVSRFEKVGAHSDVELDAQWSISPPDRGAKPVIGTSRIRVRPSGDSFPEIVAAMSSAVDKLAQEIAEATTSLARR
jgi:uncharacterized protein